MHGKPWLRHTAALGRDLCGLRMGVPTNYYFDLLEPEVEAAVRRAIADLKTQGVAAKAVTLPSMRYAGALRIASLADSIVTHEPYLEAHRQDYGPDVLYRVLAGQFVLGRDYSKALKVQRLIKEEHARVLQEVDFLVTPTTPVGAPRTDIYARRHRAPRAGAGVGYSG
jgi:aspartyl-tRNA(Asn)/glutamyl-tRNA(Gln) amidotransferase subunit A